MFTKGKVLSKGREADLENGSDASIDKSKESEHQGEECKLLIIVFKLGSDQSVHLN